MPPDLGADRADRVDMADTADTADRAEVWPAPHADMPNGAEMADLHEC
jgi:hypothetical protein